MCKGAALRKCDFVGEAASWLWRRSQGETGVGVLLEVVCGCTLGELEATMKLHCLLCSTHGLLVGTHNMVKKGIEYIATGMRR